MIRKLDIIQTLAKIGRLLSILALIISALSVIGCVFNFGFSGPVMMYRDIGGTHILRDFLGAPVEITEKARFAVFAAMLMIYAAHTAVAFLAVRYFSNELVEGTPFTFYGADEMKRLGLITVTAPLAAKALARIILAFFTDGGLIDIRLVDGVLIIGIMLFVMSSICRYGAILRDEMLASLHGQPKIALEDTDDNQERLAAKEEILRKIRGYARYGRAAGIIALIMAAASMAVIGVLTVTGTQRPDDTVIPGAAFSDIVCLMLMLVSVAAVAVLCARYFRHELAAGTPFTLSGAKELKHLGIITIAAGTVRCVVSAFCSTMLFDSPGSPIALGVMFIAMSSIYSYGAGLLEEKEKNPLT